MQKQVKKICNSTQKKISAKHIFVFKPQHSGQLEFWYILKQTAYFCNIFLHISVSGKDSIIMEGHKDINIYQNDIQ